jgi:hypothetical protein
MRDMLNYDIFFKNQYLDIIVQKIVKNEKD